MSGYAAHDLLLAVCAAALLRGGHVAPLGGQALQMGEALRDGGAFPCRTALALPTVRLPTAAAQDAPVPRRGGLVKAGGGAVWSGAGRTAAQTLLCTICKHTSAIALSLAQPLRRALPTPATLRPRSSGITGGRASAPFRHRLHAKCLDLIRFSLHRR